MRHANKAENMTHTHSGKKAVKKNKQIEKSYKLNVPDKDFKTSIISIKEPMEGKAPRWRRSRMGKTLSPPQIHQKSI